MLKTEDIDPPPENIDWVEKLTDLLKTAHNIGGNWDPESESDFQKASEEFGYFEPYSLSKRPLFYDSNWPISTIRALRRKSNQIGLAEFRCTKKTPTSGRTLKKVDRDPKKRKLNQ